MSAYLPALGLYAGVVIDKINRLWFGHNNILLIGGLAFLRSCFNSLFQPAFNSFIPMLFPKKRLVRVNALLATSGQLAWILGPAIVGLPVLIKYVLHGSASDFAFAEMYG